MDPRKINDRISVAPQLLIEDVAAAKAAGFVAIIDNRPDGEEPNQPLAAMMAKEAEKQAIAFYHLPLTPGQLNEVLVTAFAEVMDAANGPVLAYCRSGTRSATLWALSQAGKQAPDSILNAAAEAGYNLQNLRPLLTPSQD